RSRQSGVLPNLEFARQQLVRVFDLMRSSGRVRYARTRQSSVTDSTAASKLSPFQPDGVAQVRRPRFHPLHAEVLADPYPSYRQLRDDAPVLWDRRFGWLVFRYDDVAAGLRDPRLSARRPGPDDPIPRILQPVADEIRYVRTVQGQWLLC